MSSYCDHYHSTCDCCVLWSNGHHPNDYASSYLWGPDNIGSALYGSATTVDSEGHNEGFCWPHIMPQQQQPELQIPSQAYANYAMGPLQVSFSFRVEPPLISYVMCWYLVWCFLSAFRFLCVCQIHQWGLNHWDL